GSFDLSLETAKNYLLAAANYLTSDLLGLVADTEDYTLPSAEDYAELIKMVVDGEITSRSAKDILTIMIREGGDPRKIAEEKGLFQITDESAVLAIVEKIIADNQSVFEEFKSGKEKSLMFLIGQAMKESKGSANPEILKKLFSEKAK
ncbi:MAG TPA: Asp-tRNA(Asn)/Glu-tRNA(Gln) amidotransferase GatCAB subunit B, partial [Candidatus Paceibacterota bacterium]|nr:Asp-tRNA(Asn)/Glu-tRNA(Gln) amidotransferase GatCAB subunit B [Candidatus Paceibacterota bacterium]